MKSLIRGTTGKTVIRKFKKKRGVACPDMPTVPSAGPQRWQILPRVMLPATVARPAPNTDMIARGIARKSMKDEWGRLCNEKESGTKDDREWDGVAKMVR